MNIGALPGLWLDILIEMLLALATAIFVVVILGILLNFALKGGRDS